MFFLKNALGAALLGRGIAEAALHEVGAVVVSVVLEVGVVLARIVVARLTADLLLRALRVRLDPALALRAVRPVLARLVLAALKAAR